MHTDWWSANPEDPRHGDHVAARRVSARCVSILVAVVLLGVNFVHGRHARAEPVSREVAEQIFQKLYEDRAAIKQAYVEWKVDVLADTRQAYMAGATCHFKGWYDFSSSRFRIDCDRHTPADPAKSRKTRFAFVNDTYLLVPDERVVGLELHGLDQSYMKGNGGAASALIYDLTSDVRLIGVLAVPAIYLKNYSLNDILVQAELFAKYELTDEELEGRRTTKLAMYGVQNNTVNMSYWFSRDDGDMPVQIIAERTGPSATAPSSVAARSRSRWQSIEDPARPGVTVRIPTETITQWYDGDQLVVHERVTIHKAQCGVTPDEVLFRWEGMNLPERYVVSYSDGNTKKMKEWNGKTRSFGPWKPKIIRPNPPIPPAATVSNPASGTVGAIVMIHIVAIVGLVVALFIMRRMRSHS